MKKTLSLDEFDVVFDDWWGSLQHEHFKCETLQEYSVPGENELLSLYYSGEIERLRKKIRSSIEEDESDWLDAQERNVRQVRLHVIEEPLSDYLKFEIEFYKVGIEYGEEICLSRYQDLSSQVKEELQDFALFDNKRAFIINYKKNGQPVNVLATDEEEDIERLSELRVEIERPAIPLQEYLDHCSS